MRFIELYQYGIFFLRIIIFRQIKYSLIGFILIVCPFHQLCSSPFVFTLLRISIRYTDRIGEIGFAPPQITEFWHILTIPDAILLIIRETMNRIDIRTFRKLLQTTFHVKRINAFIHRILIPHTDYNRLVRFENFLINIAGHFTDRSLIFAAISLGETFRLTFSG